MISRKRAQQQEEESSTERWLVSYADFITLLFAFFTTLYAISTVDAQKAGKLITSMRASFDSAIFDSGSTTLTVSQGPGGISSSSREILQSLAPSNGIDATQINFKGMAGTKFANTTRGVLSGEKAMGRLKRNVESLLGADILKGLVRLHIEPRGLVISLSETGMYDSGSDQIKPAGKQMLDTIATTLVSLGNYIRVEGHTDNVPIHNERFPSNWELSTARATGVISYLIVKFGLFPESLSAAGYAEYRPTASNDTEEGKARNRRVDIIVLNPAAAAVEPR
ncbi:MAG: OmpA family protein [Acidobacteria bacterium]|nr:OmpA family protein [Acidobacteriota bacterium]